MAAAAGGNGKPAGTASVAHTTYRSASVLLVGWSSTHNTTAVLLGGGEGRHGSYRYSDFGGGLDGGSKRHGGTYSRSKEEKDYPHLGAFRELAEEFFGLKGDRARERAVAADDGGRGVAGGTNASRAGAAPCHPYVAGEQTCGDMDAAGPHVSGTSG